MKINIMRVRQAVLASGGGGILSPYLFNVYMDDLSQSLNCCKTGCLSGDIMINHLMHADDLVLLSPSATGLWELLLACEKYSKEHAIIYNSKKSSVLRCKNLATLHIPSPSFAVNDIAILLLLYGYYQSRFGLIPRSRGGRWGLIKATVCSKILQMFVRY